jgi:glycosyltransferase involved in cell wall biosynthesis
MNNSEIKYISIVTPCYNEQDNVDELCDRIESVMTSSGYDYEHIFIDNASTDGTVEKIKNRINSNKKIKLIVNTRNFGHIRSPYYGLLQSAGEASILIASDLQDPPELIYDFLRYWENGYKVVFAVKPKSNELILMRIIRKGYYRLMLMLSEVPLISNATGAGLYDKSVISLLKGIHDPYPYFRGLICELGFPIATVPFEQPRRKRGITKNNFFTLYDMAWLGITNHSKLPMRLLTIFGFIAALLSIFVALGYLIMKVFYWDTFELGLAPLLIGIFFFGSLQAVFIGVLGEYVLSLHTQVRGRSVPMVVESERYNF